MRVVINNCYGGFELSKEAEEFLGEDWFKIPREGDLWRADPKLIECVETLGNSASGSFSRLKIVEIPDDIEWEIEEYDGDEWVSETHRRWY